MFLSLPSLLILIGASSALSTNHIDLLPKAPLRKWTLLGASMDLHDCLVFDLDDNLYPVSSCRNKIEEFMVKNFSIDESEVSKLNSKIYKKYGRTTAGLKALGYKFDINEYFEDAHGKLPYETLKHDPVLRDLLLSAPQRKIVFTNSDKAHTTRCLNKLGLENCFDGLISFETLNNPNDKMSKAQILCKPSMESFKGATKIANLNPTKTIFFDDSASNIANAKAVGFYTVIVGKSELVSGADCALSCIYNMKEALPQIWEAEPDQKAVG